MADRVRTEIGGNITVGAGPIVDGERLYFVELEYQGDSVRLNLTPAELERLADLAWGRARAARDLAWRRKQRPRG